jgi:uncharacterized protein YcfJ
MKKRIVPIAALTAFAGVCSAAPDYTDTAQVISSTPIIERVTEQRQECTPVAAAPAPARERGLLGPIVGGVAGAVVGSQVGRGSGRTAATAAGAIAGTVIGDRVGNADVDRAAGAQPAQHCRLVESTHDMVRGYNVVYRYNGRDIATTLPYNPGSTVRVAIGVAQEPAAAQPAGLYGTTPVGTTPPPPPPPSGNYQYRY